MSISILLIDDEADYSETMRFWLMANGYNVRSASSGMDGLEEVKKERPDIVFLDMQMPDMNGIETLREIRRLYPDIPVIMVTACASDEMKREATGIGISGFFSKGEDFKGAARLISEVLREIKR
ncbi:MAG: hypothetical protein A2Y48_02500 [Nitrospirae bacterium RIFCSPLOW2_12_42_9]|nr:MAG: hypothetical protein A2Y48_02500 [Nitrospirae bacterium RIFCSPLOW2_12_42_9]HBI24000.1 hypothetical protein [Nitrospiraceae bacterium]